jgi:acyl-[acyl-carrier-protein]-phospholipid O-acyltransferase / long-chain-fatty-acid--[acyl-carrier-protein] ligase
METETTLWKNRSFIAYLSISFLNAFTDLGHKIIIQNTLFKIYDGTELRIYSAIIQAMMLLPFVMMFTPSGYLADKFPKPRIIQISALIAIPITLLITVSYYQGWFWPAFMLTFLLALQSAFYSPAKYGYIRELVGPQKLAAANSAIQATTIVAILGGTFIYSLLFEGILPAHSQTSSEILQAVRYLGFLLVGGTLLEFWLTFRLPETRPVEATLHFDFKRYLRAEYLRENLYAVWSREGIWLSIIGLSVFYAISQVVLANFGAYLKDVTGGTDTRIANGLMALSGIGFILGSLFAGKVSKNYIETGIIPLGAAGICVTLIILPLLSDYLTLAIVFTAYGFFGGIFVVPLYALIQYLANEDQAGVVMAANNFIQNIFMLIFLGVSILLASLAVSDRVTFYLLAVVTLIGTVYALRKLPQSFVRYLVASLVKQRYRVQVVGMKNLPSTGGVLLLGNHISWLDWAILQIASPRPIRFVIIRTYYEKWYLKWFLDLFQVIPITAGGSKNALEQVKNALQAGEVVALFPEGHISHNGHLSLFKAGFERAVQDTHASIVPFYLRGLWGSFFSYAAGKYRTGTRSGRLRHITVGFGPPLLATTSAAQVKQAVFETSIHTWQHYTENLEPLALSFLRTAKACGGQTAVLETRACLTYHRLLAGALLFTRHLRTQLSAQQHIGILLPSSAGSVLANLTVLMQGKTVVNLNYTSPLEVISASVQRADIQTILTSRRFLKKLENRGIDLTPLGEQVKLIPLEELGEQISSKKRLWAYLQARFLPVWLLRSLYFHKSRLDDTAAILFSSGSEGTPKGVMLSHANLMGNLKQIAAILNPNEEDVILNALPAFHAFGLTVTTFMPLIEGIPMVCQPDPMDARAVGQLVAQYKVTLLLGTSTFLRIYTKSRKVLPLMFQSLRIVVAGAERLSEEVRKSFKEKFNKDIYEGYGATETSPVTSVNILDILLSYSGEVQIGNKPGTVGLPLPGARVKIVDPETLTELPVGEAGLVLIGGTQIMQGYLKDPEKTAQVIVEQHGVRWYKSGDKGHLDEDGFLTILDRYSRFAKLGGEMVSLGAVETELTKLFDHPELEILAVTIPEQSKGEKIVLLIAGEVDIDSLRTQVLKSGINPLMQPKEYLKVAAIPKLGTGKVDFTAAKRLALK